MWNADSLPDHYKSLAEIPAKKYMAVQATGNPNHIMKGHEIPDEIIPGLADIWKDITNEYFDEFGLSDEYASYLEKKRRIMVKKLEYIATGKGTIKTIIRSLERGLSQQYDASEPAKFMDMVTVIEQNQGFAVDTETLTALKYFAYLRDIKRKAKAARERNKSRKR